MADGVIRFKQAKARNRLVWILMLIGHEPAGLICTDGQDGQTVMPVTVAGPLIGAPAVKAGIPDMEDASNRRFEGEGGPQGM